MPSVPSVRSVPASVKSVRSGLLLVVDSDSVLPCASELTTSVFWDSFCSSSYFLCSSYSSFLRFSASYFARISRASIIVYVLYYLLKSELSVIEIKFSVLTVLLEGNGNTGEFLHLVG